MSNERPGRDVTISFKNEKGEVVGECTFPVYDGKLGTFQLDTKLSSTAGNDVKAPDAHVPNFNSNSCSLWKRTFQLEGTLPGQIIICSAELPELPAFEDGQLAPYSLRATIVNVNGKQAIEVVLYFSGQQPTKLYNLSTNTSRSIFTDGTGSTRVDIPVKITAIF